MCSLILSAHPHTFPHSQVSPPSSAVPGAGIIHSALHLYQAMVLWWKKNSQSFWSDSKSVPSGRMCRRIVVSNHLDCHYCWLLPSEQDGILTDFSYWISRIFFPVWVELLTCNNRFTTTDQPAFLTIISSHSFHFHQIYFIYILNLSYYSINWYIIITNQYSN